MIIDLLLGFLVGVIELVIGWLPSTNLMYDWYVGQLPGQGGVFQPGGEGAFVQVFATVNYFLPIMEFLTLVGLYLLFWGLWSGIRLAMRLVPGVG